MRPTPRLLAVVALVAALGCARLPRPSYSFDPQNGGWELDRHTVAQGENNELFTHPVHTERLELFEVARAAPAANSAEFGGLQTPSRALPALGTTTAAPRPLGDDNVSGMAGYWIEQHGREDDAQLRSATFVLPSGQRHFIARMSSREDEVAQLQGWLRDLLLREIRFPAAQR